MEAMTIIKFQLNLSIWEDSLLSRSKKSGEVTLNLDSKPMSVFCHVGDFGCGDEGWTLIMKTYRNKVAIQAVSLKNVNGRQETLACLH